MGKFRDYLFEMSIRDAELVLGLSSTYSQDDVKTAYKLKAKENHPDLGGSVEDMQNVNSAYELLKNSNVTASGKFDWESIYKTYRVLRDQINGIIKSKLDTHLFTSYFEEQIGQPFIVQYIRYLDEDKNNPNYGGIKLKFISKDELVLFELTCSIYLVEIKNNTSLGGTAETSVPMNVSGEGFFNGRKFKLFQKNWGNKLNSIDLNQPEIFFPSSKLIKQSTKKERTKATKKDFEKLLKDVYKAKEFQGDSYGIEMVKDRYLHFTRYTHRGKGSWVIKIIEKDSNGRYPRVGDDYWSFMENNELLDTFISLKGKTESEIKIIFNSIKE